MRAIYGVDLGWKLPIIDSSSICGNEYFIPREENLSNTIQHPKYHNLFVFYSLKGRQILQKQIMDECPCSYKTLYFHSMLWIPCHLAIKRTLLLNEASYSSIMTVTTLSLIFIPNDYYSNEHESIFWCLLSSVNKRKKKKRKKKEAKRERETNQKKKWKTCIHPLQPFLHFSAKFLKELSKICLFFLLLLSLTTFFLQSTLKNWLPSMTLKLLLRTSLTTNLLPISVVICLYLL